jgi:choline dehydrogenase-like flavoprotein
MNAANHYDVIIIGSGAGGGTLVHRLAPSGKRILLLERGDYVPREKDNWDSHAVNVAAKYQTREVWRDRDGKPLHPHTNYYVGGNTKFYGAALFVCGARTSECCRITAVSRLHGRSPMTISSRTTRRPSTCIRSMGRGERIRPTRQPAHRISTPR